MSVIQGYKRVRHGGIEVGGVLFGIHEDRQVRILDFRPLECQYASGPCFVLSEADQQELAVMLGSFLTDSRLAGLEPVGWYHSHTRSEIFLSEADVEIYQRFFPADWQISMVLRPAAMDAVRVGFFFREDSGNLRTDSSYQEFMVRPPDDLKALARRAERSALPPTPVVDAASPAAPAAEAVAPPAGIPVEPPPFETPILDGPSHGLPKTRAALAGLLAALTCLGLWAIYPNRAKTPAQGSAPVSKTPAALGLTVERTAVDFRLKWNLSAQAILGAKSGKVTISDGPVRREVLFNREQLLEGSLIYSPLTNDVSLRMEVSSFQGAVSSESVRVMNSPGLGPPPDLIAVTPRAKPKDPAEAAPAKPRRTLVLPTNSGSSAQPGPEPLPAPPSLGSPVLTAKASPSLGTDLTALAPPPKEPPPAPAPAPSVARESVRSAAPPPPRATPASRPPSRGRIIWTGRLQRSGRIMIQADHASAGELSGKLPGGPVSVKAYPADLTADGVTVYSADPRHTQRVVEPAGPQNGWNQTVFSRDAKRATGIKMIEAPGPGNGWNRIVIESDAPRISMIVVEWATAQ